MKAVSGPPGFWSQKMPQAVEAREGRGRADQPPSCGGIRYRLFA